MAAFEEARRLGCDGVEFDVRRLRDGTHVIHHDPHLRFRGRRRRLDQSTLDRVRTWGVRGRRLALLEDVLVWARRHPSLLLNVELKESTGERKVLPLIDRHRAGLPTVITTFWLPVARNVKRLRPQWRVGWVSFAKDPNLVTRAQQAGLDHLVLHETNATPSMLATARNAGVRVWVWGVRSLRVARRLVAAGVEGFITDVPERLLHLREASPSRLRRRLAALAKIPAAIRQRLKRRSSAR